MSQPLPPGWYTDPLGGGGQRYWNGAQWDGIPPQPVQDYPQQVAPQPVPIGVVTTGPNHALHAVLTLFTFWLCGGWAWVWLFVALANRRQTYAVDAFGNRILPTGGRPVSPKQTGGLAVIIGLAVLLFFGVTMCGKSNDSKSTSISTRSTVAATPSWAPRTTTTIATDEVPPDFKKADILRDVLVDRGIHIGTVDDVGTTAQAICFSLRNGQSQSGIVDDLIELYPQLSPSDAAFVFGASTEAFCPS